MKTQFGRFIQQLRMSTVTEIAQKLGVSPSYVSLVLSGKKNVPKSWLKCFPVMYNMTEDEIEKMNRAAKQSVASVTIKLTGMSETKREIAVMFARKFRELDDDILQEIQRLCK